MAGKLAGLKPFSNSNHTSTTNGRHRTPQKIPCPGPEQPNPCRLPTLPASVLPETILRALAGDSRRSQGRGIRLDSNLISEVRFPPNCGRTVALWIGSRSATTGLPAEANRPAAGPERNSGPSRREFHFIQNPGVRRYFVTSTWRSRTPAGKRTARDLRAQQTATADVLKATSRLTFELRKGRQGCLDCSGVFDYRV